MDMASIQKEFARQYAAATMKKPKKEKGETNFSVMIGGFEWEVKFMEKIDINGTLCNGYCSADDFTIAIRKGMPVLARRITLIHELVHAMLCAVNTPSDTNKWGQIDEEHVAELVSRGMAELAGQRHILPKWVFNG